MTYTRIVNSPSFDKLGISTCLIKLAIEVDLFFSRGLLGAIIT